MIEVYCIEDIFIVRNKLNGLELDLYETCGRFLCDNWVQSLDFGS